MANAATVLVKFLGDASGAKRASQEAAGSVGKVGKGVDKLVAPAAVAAGAIAGIAVAAGKAAADAQQSVGSVESVFGKFAKGVVKSSEQAAGSVGLSANSYRELASQIGGQLKNAGTPMDKLAGRTDNLIKTGADLAATFGGSTQDAVAALGASLRGEADPAERYGLALSQTAVNAQLAAKGQSKLTGKALQAAKAQATLDLIAQQSADSQGQFARESDTASGAQAIATAKYQDASAALGQALIPAMTTLATVLSKVADWAKQHPALFWAIVGVIFAVAAAILILNVALGIMTTVATIAGTTIGAAMLAAFWPIVLIIAIIAAVIIIVILLWKKCDWFRNAVIAIWNAIKAAAVAVWNWIKAAWLSMIATMSARIRSFIAVVVAVWNAIRAAAAAVWGWLKSAWSAVVTFIGARVRSLTSVFSSVWNTIKGAAKSVADWVRGVWDRTFSALKGAVSGLGAVLSAPFHAVKDAISGAIGLVQSLIDKLKNIKVPHISLPFGLGSKAAPALPARSYSGTGMPRVGAAVGQRSVGATAGPTFVIQAVDPESAARTINRIQRRHTQRVGLTGTIRTA